MSPQHSQSGTRVSAILPVRNEARFIEATLRSLQNQKSCDFALEILVIDGLSDDGTREKVEALAMEDARIKLFSNPSRNTPAALNAGLHAATGEFVCIMGAHASYDADYISVCLEELHRHGAVACSGKVVTAPANDNGQARLVAWAAGHPFASSSRSVRTQPEGYADTVPFPVVRRDALLEAGGYNENLLRNQDNDMNQRLRATGFKLYVTGKTQCRYYARPTIMSFLQYGFRSGLWNAFSLRQNAASLGLRHLAPLGFVTMLLALVSGLLASAIAHSPLAMWFALASLVILGSHIVAGTLAGIQVALQKKAATALWMGPLILAFHCAYGLGTLRGLLLSPEFPARVALEAMPQPTKDSL